MKKGVFSLLLTLGAISGASAQVLTNEHVDLSIGFTAPSSFLMEVRDDDNATNYAPSAAVLTVLPGAQAPRPAGSLFDFIGVGAGQTYWRLPQSQNPNLLYLGVGAYNVNAADTDSYDASAESGGRVVGTGDWVRLRLDSVTGAGGTAAPGFFSVWQSGDFGPNVMMSSFSGGTTADDSLWVVAGGHSHFHWGFTAPGVYEVTMRPSVRRSGLQVESTTPFTFIFNVQGVVPEPGTLPLALLALPLAALRLRQIRKGLKG
jgi:surface-anchored protein